MSNPQGEHTIDDLAAISGVPSRTIRFYQSKGVLPRPELKGRVAYYGPAHVERLKLIASLQDRGLRIDGIRELMARIDKGELDVNEWLGLDAQLQSAWAADEPRTVTEAELAEITGPKRPGIVAALVLTPFTVFTLDVVASHGLLGFLTLAGDEPWALQVLLDLGIAGSFAIGWMVADARRRGLTVWPFVIATVTCGSIGLLSYVIRRGVGRGVQVRLAQDAARSVNAYVPIGAAAQAVFQVAQAQGLGSAEDAVLLEAYRAMMRDPARD